MSEPKKFSETWWKELCGDGSPATNFHSSVRVWSEMAVRDVVCRAFAAPIQEADDLRVRVEALARHIIITRDVIHALNGHRGDRETCEVGPCGPSNAALRGAGRGEA